MNASDAYRYLPIFDERRTPALGRRSAPPDKATGNEVADRVSASAYVFDDDIRLAVNLALATSRPLLVTGPPGSGKSSLARAVAELAGWSYVERTITSRIQAHDLLYEIDYLRRLQDAQQNKLGGDERPYIVPGPLFWSFAPEKARKLLEDSGRSQSIPGGIRKNITHSVVLLDEIDKADPDVPNDLLIPFGHLAFEIAELGEKIECPSSAAPLLVLTSNGERDLPPAFLRRCVELNIKAAEKSPAGLAKLFAIVRKHGLDLDDRNLEELAEAFFAAPRSEGREPNPAEFLDLIRAWRQLQLTTHVHKSTLQAVLAAITIGPRKSVL